MASINVANVVVNMAAKQARSAWKRLRNKKDQVKRKTRLTIRRRLTDSISHRIKGRVMQGLGALGGYRTVGRILSSGNGDPWGEALTPIQGAIVRFMDETIGYSAAARKQTANEVAAAFATSVGRHGSTDLAKQMFQTKLQINTEIEMGRSIFRSDPRFAGATLGELIEQSMKGYFALIQKSFSRMMEGFGK